jgi:hypothetical protein
MAGPYLQLAHAQVFSDWIEASGFSQVQYRWKKGDAKGCDVEYRDVQQRVKQKYKTRIVYQSDGDEHHQANEILSFTDTPTATDHVQACTIITDITVTRY